MAREIIIIRGEINIIPKKEIKKSKTLLIIKSILSMLLEESQIFKHG